MATRQTPTKANRKSGTGPKAHRATKPTPATRVNPSSADPVEKKLKWAAAGLNCFAAAIKAAAASWPYAEHLPDLIDHWINQL